MAAVARPLAGQVALVTGAGSGIGRAIALAFGRAGAAVVLAGRRRTPLEATAAELAAADGTALAHPADVTDPAAVEQLVEAADAWRGRLDIVVNGAGTGRFATLPETTPSLWAETLAVNLTGPYLVSRAAWPRLARGGGLILNIGSVAGRRPFPGCAAYGASKAGLAGLSAVLAEEGRAAGIRVTLLAPGAVDSPFWDRQAGQFDRGRMLRPEDVADAALAVALQPPRSQVEEIVLGPAAGPV